MILQEIRRYYNCRCYAEPAFKDPPIEPVYPELILIPATRVIKLIKNGIKKIKKASGRVRKKTPNPKEILMPNGKPIGQRGNRSDIRVIKGGDKEARKIFDKLRKTGKPSTPKGYDGKGVKLPNGDWVGYRPNSKSKLPTIDIKIEGIPFKKIHFL